MKTSTEELDRALAALDQYLNALEAKKLEDPAEVVDRVLAKAQTAMMDGKLSPVDFHKLDLMARHVKRPDNTSLMMKALVTGVMTGAVSVVEANQRANIVSGPLAQLGDPSTWFSCWNRRPAPAQP